MKLDKRWFISGCTNKEELERLAKALGYSVKPKFTKEEWYETLGNLAYQKINMWKTNRSISATEQLKIMELHRKGLYLKEGQKN